MTYFRPAYRVDRTISNLLPFIMLVALACMACLFAILAYHNKLRLQNAGLSLILIIIALYLLYPLASYDRRIYRHYDIPERHGIFLANNKWIKANYTSQNQIKLYDRKTLTPIVIESQAGSFKQAYVTADGRYLATNAMDQEITIWDLDALLIDAKLKQ